MLNSIAVLSRFRLACLGLVGIAGGTLFVIRLL